MENSLISSLKSDFLKFLNSEDDEDNNSLNDKCLISNKPLETNYITLNCSHKFNYDNIYNEVYRQKYKINTLESQRLKINQIKCPYCREITNNLLPYIERENIEKIKGVNHPSVYSLSLFKCNYIYKSGKNKNCKCNKNAWNFMENEGWLCKTHNILIQKKEDKVEKKIDIEQFKIDNSENYKKYIKFTNQSLKLLLKENNLKVSGNKIELIKRLIDNNIYANT